MKDPLKVAQGKRNRKKGADFERKVRVDLEIKGWFVLKNPNNLIDNKFSQGKSKFNPFTRKVQMMSGGFPDFIIYRRDNVNFNIVFVECKTNGKLDKVEKEKKEYFLKNKMCSEFWIAKKDLKKVTYLF